MPPLWTFISKVKDEIQSESEEKGVRWGLYVSWGRMLACVAGRSPRGNCGEYRTPAKEPNTGHLMMMLGPSIGHPRTLMARPMMTAVDTEDNRDIKRYEELLEMTELRAQPPGEAYLLTEDISFFFFVFVGFALACIEILKPRLEVIFTPPYGDRDIGKASPKGYCCNPERHVMAHSNTESAPLV
ncbi:hypothetical protein DM02DRAFT_657480 [Periconia macrospinosa]|uniref:Uncharacterized protein n=1 Tax=Periconia macrospinosa TaxID=97972 RepID=A0A2V1DM88_9PLEO|nr:hypothetical protein DM02DRAFT_657480 [Periconia macrospinosa]